MDADGLVKKAQQAIKTRDYDLARDYLKEAASLAPLRSDIREMLEYVIRRQSSNRQEERPRRSPARPAPEQEVELERPQRLERPTRGLFQTERDRSRMAPRPQILNDMPPPRRQPFLLTILTFVAIALLVAGGAAALFLMKPDLLKFAQWGNPAGTESLVNGVPDGPTATPVPSVDRLTEALASATSHVNQNAYEEAVKTIQSAMDAIPEEKENLTKRLGEIYFTWGKDLYRESKLDASVEKLKLAVNAYPENSQIHYWLGEAYYLKARSSEKRTLRSREGDFADAERALKEAIRLDANMLKGYYTLGKAFAAREQFSKAAEYYNEVIRRAPESEEAERARRDLRMMDLR